MEAIIKGNKVWEARQWIEERRCESPPCAESLAIFHIHVPTELALS